MISSQRRSLLPKGIYKNNLSQLTRSPAPTVTIASRPNVRSTRSPLCNVSDQNPSVNGKTALLSNGSNLLSTKVPSDFKGRCLKIELTREKIQITYQRCFFSACGRGHGSAARLLANVVCQKGAEARTHTHM